MPVYEKEGSIQDASEKYVCAIACNTAKDVSYKKEPNLVRLIKHFPDMNVYQIYKQTGTKFKLGTTHRADNKIVMFTHFYAGPGGKFPNDNAKKRKTWFMTALTELQSIPNLGSIAFDYGNLFNDCENPEAEYKQILEDFTDTYRLNNKSTVTVMIYKSSETAVHSVEGRAKSSAKVRAELQTQRIQARKKTSKTITIPKLVVTDRTDVSDFSLTVADFCRYNIVDELRAGKILVELPLDASWRWLLSDTTAKVALDKVQESLGSVIHEDTTFPEPDLIFNAFNHCKFSDLSVVILGQDPYPTRGHAHGLSFSVQRGVNVPRSLGNIYKALENDDDVDFTRPKHGCLESWADQGVLLLNAALTVKEKSAGAHLAEWSPFTDRVIKLISDRAQNVVFMLWGKKAQAKERFINASRHKVLKFNHPSPQVMGNTFGTECKHFSEANTYLQENDKPAINWQL